MIILIEKRARRLTLYEENRSLFSCPVALSKNPLSFKEREGDMKTPEGRYFVCLKRGTGKFGPALGLNYPNAADARRGVNKGLISASLLPLFLRAEEARVRPPWGTPLGGEIYLHGKGASADWTAGCIALSDGDMYALYLLVQCGTAVELRP